MNGFAFGKSHAVRIIYEGGREFRDACGHLLMGGRPVENQIKGLFSAVPVEASISSENLYA